jgi:hypothetical protein
MCHVYIVDQRPIDVKVPWSPEVLFTVDPPNWSKLITVLTRRADLLHVLARQLPDGQQEVTRVEVAMCNFTVV